MQQSQSAHPGVGPTEFVILVAGMMAIGALGTDTMLPALPAIGRELGIANLNRTQWVIGAYSLGFGSTQLLWGPLADRYGRKPILFFALIGYALMAAICAVAQSFVLLVGARAVQGMLAGSSRVLVSCVVRDCYQGRQMARVMSLAQMIFFAVPILAPSIGSAILAVAPWRFIFIALTVLGAAIALWTRIRLPETLHPEDRRAIAIKPLTAAWRATLSDRFSLGYSLASAVTYGALMAYIFTSEAIIGTLFHAPHAFPYAFAGIAAGMGLLSFANAGLVLRYGTRRLSHSALLGVTLIGMIHLGWALAGRETLHSYIAFQMCQLALFGLIGANFSAMAMENVGHFAGTASSVQGFISSFGGAAIGMLIGQTYNGTTIPVAAGFAVAGTVSIIIVLITEGGRLFVARNLPVSDQ